MITPAPTPWALLVPELACLDLERSRRFYVDVLGARIRCERDEDGVAYLEFGAAQLMLERAESSWVVAPFEAPLGRGINLQFEVPDVDAIARRCAEAGVVPFRPVADHGYRAGAIEHGQRELLVQDPDGYLLRVAEPLGERMRR